MIIAVKPNHPNEIRAYTTVQIGDKPQLLCLKTPNNTSMFIPIGDWEGSDCSNNSNDFDKTFDDFVSRNEVEQTWYKGEEVVIRL